MSNSGHGGRSIKELIRDGGGRHAIAEASENTKKHVSFEAVAKWPKIGIDEDHWELMMSLTGASIEEIYAANRRAEKEASAARKSRKSRRVAVSAQRA